MSNRLSPRLKAAVSDWQRLQRELLELASEIPETRTPEEILGDLLAPVLSAMEKYGKRTSITIYRDGSVTVQTGDGERFWKILARNTTLYGLLSTDLSTWPTLREVNCQWSSHLPTARTGDYRDRETWQFGTTKGAGDITE